MSKKKGGGNGGMNRGGTGVKKKADNNKKDIDHYEEHWSQEEVHRAKQHMTVLIGTLKVFPTKRKIGYVAVPGLSVDIMIEDERMRNRAFIGDEVAVELREESEWVAIPLDSSSNRVEKAEGVQEVRKKLEDMEVSEHTTELWRPREDLLDSFKGCEKLDEVEASEGEEDQEHALLNRLNETSQTKQLQPCGRIVRIMAKAKGGHKSIVGGISLTLKSPLESGQPLPEYVRHCTFKPSNAAYPHFIVPRLSLPEAFRSDPTSFVDHIYLLDAALLWPASSKLPFGENVRSIGEVGTIQAETTALLEENDLNHTIFSDDIMNSLKELLQQTSESSDGAGVKKSESEGWTIPKSEIAKRLDLRNTRIFTIDPPNAKDLDDALHITELPSHDGSPQCCSFEVGVHIADVSYFVREDTSIDEEALHRATSVYLVQKVIPMLPPLLCEQLCSLNPNVDRLAFSCIFRMTSDGCLCPHHKPFFGRTVICSCAKLDYATAQRMVDGLIPSSPSESHANEDSHIDDLPDTIWEMRRRPPLACNQKAWQISRDVQLLHSLAMSRRSRRLAHGALSLNNPKITFRLDGDGNPVSSSLYEIRESNQLIEEYMLLANYLVAEKLVETVGRYGFLRCHPPPNPSGLESLVALGARVGYDIDISSAHALQRSLKDISASEDPVVARAITTLMMLPMTNAEYFVVDKTPSSHWKHYALAIPYYTHFTSPIRRYADIVVHRFLQHGLAMEQAEDRNSVERMLKGKYSLSKLHQVAEQCNTRKKSAHNAQLRSDEVFLGVYLTQNPAPHAKAVVIGVGEKSFSVLVLEYSLQARIFLDKIEWVSQELSSFDEKTKTLTLRHLSGKVIHLTYLTPVRTSVFASVKPPPVTVEVSLSELSFDA